MKAKTFEQPVLEDAGRTWELDCGRRVERPPMTWEHIFVGRNLRRQADGSDAEAHDTGGVVPVLSLPGVAFDLDARVARL